MFTVWSSKYFLQLKNIPRTSSLSFSHNLKSQTVKSSLEHKARTELHNVISLMDSMTHLTLQRLVSDGELDVRAGLGTALLPRLLEKQRHGADSPPQCDTRCRSHQRHATRLHPTSNTSLLWVFIEHSVVNSRLPSWQAGLQAERLTCQVVSPLQSNFSVPSSDS